MSVVNPTVASSDSGLTNNSYVLMNVAHWHLCLPSADVAAFELLSDALCTRKKRKLHWSISWRNQNIPVLALDHDIKLLPVESIETGFIVLLKGEDQQPKRGLVCEALEVIDYSELSSVTPMPAIMSSASSLFHELSFYQNELVCITKGDKLLNYIEHLEASNE